MKREYTRIEADGMEASRAAVLFLELIKRHLIQFDRETFNVKIGLGWSVKVPVAIGPDDQISHLDSQEEFLTKSNCQCHLSCHCQKLKIG